MPAPEPLLSICENLKSPAVLQSGVTKTQDGQWALWVQVRRGTTIPIAEIENLAAGFPIVYEEDQSDSLPVARPAYPTLGE